MNSRERVLRAVTFGYPYNGPQNLDTKMAENKI